MFRLTREVRFALTDDASHQLAHKPTNSYGGYPSLTGIGTWLALQITLEGELETRSNYLRNIKEIDEVVRRTAIPFVARLKNENSTGFELPATLLELLKDAWPGTQLAEVRLALSPFMNVTCLAREHPMVRLSQKFEFSASHRLHNPALGDEDNRRTFGKCNNPHGHGHNYELQVTISGKPGEKGVLIDVPEFERIVATTVIDRFDHKNLNVETSEFREVIPSVENIAKTIYGLLKPKLKTDRASLASVTVWETPKTWCEYSE